MSKCVRVSVRLRVLLGVSLLAAASCDRKPKDDEAETAAPPPAATPANPEPVSAPPSETKEAAKPPSPTPRQPTESPASPAAPATPALSPEAAAIPRVELSRVANSVRNEVETAYSAATAHPRNPQLVGDLGAYYLVSHEPVAAVECFTLASKLDPGNLRWWYYQGLASMMAFDAPQAAVAFENAIAADPSYVPAHVQLGNAWLERDAAKARAAFDRALKIHPDDPAAQTGLGRCELAERKPDRAIAILEKIVQSDAVNNIARQALSDAYEALGRHGDAAEQRKKLIAGEPPPLLSDPLRLELMEKSRNAEFLIRIGQQLAAAGRMDRAAFLIRRAIDTDASRTASRENLGIVLAMQGRYAEAAEQFRTVLSLDGSKYLAESNLGHIAVETGDYAEAVERFKSVLMARPTEPVTLERYGMLLLAVGKPEEAAPLLERRAQQGSTEADARMNLALCRLCQGRHDDAAREYRSAVEHLPNRRNGASILVSKLSMLAMNQYAATNKPDAAGRITPKSISLLAAAVRSKGLEEDAEAILRYQDAMAAEGLQRAQRGGGSGPALCLKAMLPGDRDGILQSALAAVYGFLGRFDESAEAYRAAIQAAPDPFAVKASLASLETRRGRLEDAESLYRQAIQLKPHDESVRLQFATMLIEKRRRPSEAESFLRETLRTHPQSSPAHYLLGRALADQGKTEDARAAWRRAIEIQPSSPEPYLYLAESFLKASDHDAARKLLHQGLNHAADSATLANGFAWILATTASEALRNGQEAVRWARHACNLTGDRNPEFLDTLATAYGAAGQFDAAVEAEKQAIALAEKSSGGSSVGEFRKRLNLFESKQPYIQGS